MAGKQVRTAHDDLTYRIIGCAMAVHREHGPGYREDTYQRALESRFEGDGLSFQSQRLLEVYDRDSGGVLIGYYIPDLIVEERVVVELKALQALENSHIAQVIAYLAVTECSVGLLLNFGVRSLQYRRIFPPKSIVEHRTNRQWLFVPDWLRQES